MEEHQETRKGVTQRQQLAKQLIDPCMSTLRSTRCGGKHQGDGQQQLWAFRLQLVSSLPLTHQ